MLFSVPGGTSTLNFPDTVTKPSFEGCLNWRWLPFVRTRYHPSPSNSLMTSFTFIIERIIQCGKTIAVDSTHTLPTPLPIFLTQQILLNLARRSPRQRVGEAHHSRAFEVRHVRAAELDDLVFGRGHLRFQHDHRGDGLAPLFVRDSDAGGFEHRRVFVQHP